MSTRVRERGAGLVLIIGVIAALAVMASTLVALTGSVQHNTYSDRMRVKAFNVAEAAVDTGMYELSAAWPETAGTGPQFDTTWQQAFRDGGFADASQYPDPATGQFVTVYYYDNQASVNKSINWDAGQPNDAALADNKMWLVGQAGVGPKATRIQVLVERTFANLTLPRGIALCAGGNLLSNGGGNNPKILVEVAPDPVVVPGGITSVHVGGTIEELDVTTTGIAQNVGSKALPPSKVFPETLVQQLKGMAVLYGRYFTSLSAAEASPVNPQWSPQGGISGLTVIEASPSTDLKVQGNTVVNSEAKPGILLVLGGSTLSWGGTAQYYGVIYVDGPMNTSHGTGDIHGMVVTTSTEDMKGTPHILYNDNCIARLSNRFTQTVQLVQNTWRELKPKSGP